jgi:hypothetical protein
MKTTKTRTQSSVENALQVIKVATKNRLSLSEASRQKGFGRNYVSDVKARIADNLANKNVSKDTYKAFKNALKEYTKTV